ncbi:MAG: hypothetical protein ABIF01_04410, partial [Candidatus Micrarchaeota archaeon]
MGGDSGQGPMAMKRQPEAPKQVSSFEELEKRAREQGYSVNKVTGVDFGTALMFADQMDGSFGQSGVKTGKRPQVVEAGMGSLTTTLFLSALETGVGVGLWKLGSKPTATEVPEYDEAGR